MRMVGMVGVVRLHPLLLGLRVEWFRWVMRFPHSSNECRLGGIVCADGRCR